MRGKEKHLNKTKTTKKIKRSVALVVFRCCPPDIYLWVHVLLKPSSVLSCATYSKTPKSILTLTKVRLTIVLNTEGKGVRGARLTVSSKHKQC